MAYCRNCGQQIDDMEVICPMCGVQQRAMEEDTGSFGWGVLGFFFPIVGLILYIVWMDTKPLTARMAGKGALIAAIIWAVLIIIIMILAILFVTSYNEPLRYYFH